MLKDANLTESQKTAKNNEYQTLLKEMTNAQVRKLKQLNGASLAISIENCLTEVQGEALGSGCGQLVAQLHHRFVIWIVMPVLINVMPIVFCLWKRRKKAERVPSLKKSLASLSEFNHWYNWVTLRYALNISREMQKIF